MYLKNHFEFFGTIHIVFSLIENLSEYTLTVNTIGFTKELYNASIAANLMDTSYLLINEPFCRENPDRSRQHGTNETRRIRRRD